MAKQSAKIKEKKAAKSVNNYLTVLRKLLSVAQEWALIPFVPKARLRPERGHPHRRHRLLGVGERQAGPPRLVTPLLRRPARRRLTGALAIALGRRNG